MPTYQYACTACEHQLEVVQSFSDPALTECPVCAGRLRKLFSAVGIVFKGSGFYRTDSRSGNGSGPAGDGSSTKTASSSGDSGGTSSAGGSSAGGTSSPGDSSATSSGSSGSGSATSGGTPKPKAAVA